MMIMEVLHNDIGSHNFKLLNLHSKVPSKRGW